MSAVVACQTYRRGAPRKECSSAVEIRNSNRRIYGTLLDLSASGAGAQIDSAEKLGGRVHVVLRHNSQERIIGADVRYSVAGRVGLRFVEPQPLLVTDTPPHPIAEIIRERIEAGEITEAEVLKTLGVPPSYLRALFVGDRQPWTLSAANISGLSEATGIRIEDLAPMLIRTKRPSAPPLA